MKAYGAELILTPKSGGMEYARDLADTMVKQGKGVVLDCLRMRTIHVPTTRRPARNCGSRPAAASRTS